MKHMVRFYEDGLGIGPFSSYGPNHMGTQKQPWGALLAAVYDPDGNIVGLTQRKEQ
jgi:hypothetical protein